MTSDEVLQSRHYLEMQGRGRMGEDYAYGEISSRLVGTGLTVRLATEDHYKAPFDIEILKGDKVLVGIENKDLVSTSKGTQIRGCQKHRKLRYAREHGIRLILTTVTRRDIHAIGFKEGLVNGHPLVFDYNLDRLVGRILTVSMEDRTA